MSYCRFSDNDYLCDVYVWADCDGGFRTEVASRRYVFERPFPPAVEWSPENETAWAARHSEVSEMLDVDAMVSIDLPYAGQGFSDSSAGETADRLEVLRATGYIVPQYAIDNLRAEQAELSEQKP